MMESNNLCGFQCCYPKWLQRFANQKTFILVYGFLGTTQAMATIYFTITMTTIEKRFQIPGAIMGFILCGNEVSQILLSLILSYLGGQRNRPRWISWGIFFCAASCFVLASPHALYGAGEDAFKLTKEYGANTFRDWKNDTDALSMYKNKYRLCISETSIGKDCTTTEPYLTPLVLLFTSQFILGIGNSLYYSLGQSYLDDNVEKTNTPFLLGFALSLKMLGPAFGFILGYSSLRMYIDPFKTPTINPKDPRWLGAWWLGWVILGLLMIVFSFLIGLFPKEMKVKPSKVSVKKINDGDEKIRIKDFGPAFKRLIQNKILVCNAFSSFFYLLGSNCYLVFLSKYIEVQFQKARSDATIITGPVTLFGMAIGFFSSGYIISKYKPKAKHVLFWNIIVGTLYVSKQFLNLTLACSDESSKSFTPKILSNLTMDCNMECNCHATPYTPICFENEGKTFFSPCHAGCDTWNEEKQDFRDCSCVESTFESPIFTSGACSKGCALGFWIFTIVGAINNCLSSSGRVGNTLVDYRCISTRDKSFAQGFILMLTSIASLLGPIIFASIIDTTCLIWTGECGTKGSCQLYDQRSFRYRFNLVALTFTAIGVIFDILVWQFGKTLKIYGEAEDQRDDVKTVETNF